MGVRTCARTHELIKKGKNASACVRAVADQSQNKEAGAKTAPVKAGSKPGSAGKGEAAKRGQ
ncbi:MAG TPA: hypothetical protein VNJ31_03910 [Methyloceanibacter sp.]|nr:hypothetical protein [Methyloceanibacter sp.]